MTVYATQGGLGAGKGIFAAYIMSLTYNDGDDSIRCASNYPFYTEFMGPDSTKSITVLPFDVRYSDFISLGWGSPESSKDKFGVLILDECANFLNSRDFRHPDRAKVLDWIRHARKWHWDVYLIIQHPDHLDSQVRDLIDNVVVLNRLDHIRIPFLSTLMDFIKFFKGNGSDKSNVSLLPHLVQASYYYKKKGAYDKPINRISFLAKRYYSFYDTDLIFTDGNELIGEKSVDMRASYSLIPGRTMSGNVKDIKSSEKTNDSSKSETTPVKKKGCFSLIIQFLFVVVFGYISYLIWSSYFGNGDENIESVSVDPAVAHVANAAVPVPAAPALPVLSSKWRLSGYLVSSDTERYFILTDNSGNVRYYASEQKYKGRFTQLVIGNELITFYSGSSGNAANQPDMTEQFNSGVSKATSSLFN